MYRHLAKRLINCSFVFIFFIFLIQTCFSVKWNMNKMCLKSKNIFNFISNETNDLIHLDFRQLTLLKLLSDTIENLNALIVWGFCARIINIIKYFRNFGVPAIQFDLKAASLMSELWNYTINLFIIEKRYFSYML